MIVKRKRTFPSFRTEEESFLTFMRILTFLAKSSPTKLGIRYVKTWIEEVVLFIEVLDLLSKSKRQKPDIYFYQLKVKGSAVQK